MNAIRQGDKITGVEIIDSPEALFASQATQIAAWNKFSRNNSNGGSDQADPIRMPVMKTSTPPTTT